MKDVYPESALAHKYCVGRGLEIGGAAHNSFGLNALNVDITDSMETIFKQEEIQRTGKALPVDIVASGDAIPLPDKSQDFIVSSHVLEHFPDPIKALIEWDRLLKPGGVIFMIVPHMERTFDRDNPRTTLQHLIDDYRKGETAPHPSHAGHDHCWITEDIVDLVNWMISYLGVKWQIMDVQDQDDKAGNGFSIAIKKLPMKNIHIIMPFSRHENWGKLLKAYKPMNVIIHTLAYRGEEQPKPSVSWVFPFWVGRGSNEEFNQSVLLNAFIKKADIVDDDYYVTANDDDMYEAGVFDAIRQMDDPVIVISMKRGYQIPKGLSVDKQYEPTTLFAFPENIRTGFVGGEQVFMKGSVFKTVYFDEELPGVADGFVAEYLKKNFPIRYEKNLFALFNYYEPGRWEREGLKISFGVLVNDLVRLDMCLKQSPISGQMHIFREAESATKGLNRLLDTIEKEGADIAALVHQDMSFRHDWIGQVKGQIEKLPDSWIVAGVIGKDMEGRVCGKFHDTRIAPIFNTSEIHKFPQPACCFDEAVILVNMKKGFRFDEAMDGWDLYGTLCVLQAWEMGGTAWIIDAFCEHHCMRPFTWIPDDLFGKNYKWLYDRFKHASRVDSTAMTEIWDERRFETSASPEAEGVAA